jgi:hypothetical protein
MEEPMIETAIKDDAGNVIGVQQTIKVAENKFEEHPDSYFPRVFIYVREAVTWYEILKSGAAIPWTAKPEGFPFWIIDTDRLSDLGVHRA